MAKKTPLSFLVEVQTKEAFKKLEDLETRLGKLKDSVTIKIETGNNNDLNTLVQNIKDAAQSIKDAKEAIKRDTFTSFAERVEKAATAINTLDEAFKKFNLTIGQDEGLKNFMTGLGEVITSARKVMSSLDMSHKPGDVIGSSTSKSIEQAKYEIYKLEGLMQRASSAVSIGKAFGDTSALDAQIEKVRQYRQELEKLKESGTVGGKTTSDFKAQSDYKIAVEDLKKMIAAQEKANQENAKMSASSQQAAQGTRQLSSEQRTLAQNLARSTSEMHSQSQVLSDLKSLATQYLGVWGAQGFIKNIIEIGGQLEQQRKSIGAILGDNAAGNSLFGQIKDLAIRSPFGVVELDKYTKQLSAYGFKQNELFDMTKRLADISAGAGTEVSRLALALGHVRSEGALTGYTLRQFAMNNIPMLQKLSERLSEIEGRIVSTSEIRKRVSNKEIGYEDVIAVIKDLTDEGGMFYNMQEVMSDAVNAKFKNLKDSMDIMYGEMAEGKLGDILKSIASSLMVVTRNWEDALRVIGYVAAAWTAYRINLMITNRGLGMFGSTIATTNQRLQAQRIIYGGSAMELKRLSAGAVDAMVKQGLLNKQQLLGAVAAKRLTIDQAELAAANFGVSRSELAVIAGAGRMNLAFRSLSLQVKSLGIALKAMFLNPIMIVFTAITAAFEIYSRWKQKNDEIRESIEQLGEKGSDGYKNLSETLNKLGTGKMDSAGYVTAINDIKEQLQNYAPDVTNILNQAAGIEDLAKRYEYLRSELEATKNAYVKLEQTKNFASDANQSTGGLFNDTFTENAEDYIKSLEKVRKAETNFYTHRASIESVLNSMNGKNGFSLAVDSDGNLEPLEKQIELIRSNREQYLLFSNELLHFNESAAIAWNQMNSKMYESDEIMKNQVLPDLQNFAAILDNNYAAAFGNDWKRSTENVKLAWMAVQSEIDKVPGMTDEVRRKLLNEIFNKTWKLKIDFDTTKVEEELPKWMQDLQKELDKTGIFLKADMSYEQIVDAMKKGYDTAQTTINKLGPIAIKAGIKLEGIQGLDIEKYKYLNPELYNVLQQLQQATTTKTQIDTAGQKRGIVFEGMKRDGTHKTPKTNRSGEKKDTQLEQWREEFNELKAFYSEYKRWAELVGKDKALEKIQEQGLFGKMFSNGKPIYDISQWGDALSAFMGKTDGKTTARQKFQTEIKKELSSFLADQLKESVNNAGKIMQEYISRHSEQFNLYKQIMEKTGDKGLAEQAFSDGRIWDDITREFEDKLKEISGETSIDYDMSEKDAEKHFKQVAGGFELWKKIVELTRKNYADALSKAADAQASILTNSQKIEILQDKIDKALADRSGVDHSAEVSKWREEISKLESEMFEFLPIYEKIFGDKTYKSWNDLKTAENYARDLIAHSKEGSKDPKTGKVSYYTSYYLDEDGMKKVVLTRQQLEKLKKTVDGFHKDETKKNPFATLVEDVKELYKKIKGKDTKDATSSWLKFAESLQDVSKIVGEMAGQFSDMFDALGNEGLADAMDDLQAGMNSVNNIAQGFASGGVVGGIVAAAGEAVGWIGRIAQKHDKKLDKAIQKSQREVKKLENAYSNMADAIERRLTGIYGGEEYSKMFENYKRQLEELQKQRKAEDDKKKTDEDKLIDYDQQIKEMRDNIKYFAEDMAKELYNIDVKSWASELTDAVVDAWVNGEDAAKAWHDKVIDLVKDVTKNILAQKVVEAALKPALDFITEEMTLKNGKLDEGSITQLATMLEQAGETSVGGITAVLEALKAAGYDVSENGKSSSTSGSIKSITEQTADLIASYLNAIRADVSIKREIQTDMANDIKVMSISAQSQLQQLTMIAENTRLNAEYANEIRGHTNEIKDLFRGLRNGIWKMPVA